MTVAGDEILEVYGTDFEARAMKARGEGFYTISAAGHEANAALGAVARPTDPALLHYRSGAFFLASIPHCRATYPGRSNE